VDADRLADRRQSSAAGSFRRWRGCEGNRTHAARVLGLSVRTMRQQVQANTPPTAPHTRDN
jgi:hypothetical protein